MSFCTICFISSYRTTSKFWKLLKILNLNSIKTISLSKNELGWGCWLPDFPAAAASTPSPPPACRRRWTPASASPCRRSTLRSIPAGRLSGTVWSEIVLRCDTCYRKKNNSYTTYNNVIRKICLYCCKQGVAILCIRYNGSIFLNSIACWRQLFKIVVATNRKNSSYKNVIIYVITKHMFISLKPNKFLR